MKKKLSVAVVSILLLVAFTLPSSGVEVSAGLFQSPPPGPANDNFADAIAIEGLPFYHSMDTSTATVQKREPTPSCAQGSAWGNSVWYAYTPTQSGSITARTDASFSPGLAAYTGRRLNSLTEVGSSCWGGQVSFHAEAGTTYYFQVGGMDGYGGSLTFRLAGPPPNDDFDSATLIQGLLPYIDSLDTSYATWASDDPAQCHNNGSVWYAFTPTSDILIEANTIGSDYDTTLAAYTGTRGALEMVPGACNDDYYGLQSRVRFAAAAGTTYYFLVGRCCGGGGDGGGSLVFTVQETEAPPNDDFAAATVIEEPLPFNHYADISAASLEADEPTPSCTDLSFGRSLWYAYTPTESGSVSAHVAASGPIAVAAYRGDSLSNLVEVGCRCCWGEWLTFQAEEGTTYYFQVGAMWEGGWLTFYLEVTPPPVADFWPSHYSPSVFDTVWFYNYSSDPAGAAIACSWDLGDGTTSTDWSPSHQYAADGDYTVQLTVTTPDGRSASTTRDVQVRTHDVAITKFQVPNSARVGQTRAIVVGINSKRYPEEVEVQLYKSGPGGYEWVGSLRQTVPVRPANRTTDFSFNYTFTAADANVGKVTFRAIANLIDAWDALSADNEAISMPTKVTR